LIVEYIAKFGKASRTELSQLLTDKLPDTLSESQRFDKITNLLSSLRKSGIIRVGEKRMWFLTNSSY
jgi:ATP-dependent DNA helicase RecG